LRARTAAPILAGKETIIGDSGRQGLCGLDKNYIVGPVRRSGKRRGNQKGEKGRVRRLKGSPSPAAASRRRPCQGGGGGDNGKSHLLHFLSETAWDLRVFPWKGDSLRVGTEATLRPPTKCLHVWRGEARRRALVENTDTPGGGSLSRGGGCEGGGGGVFP